MRTHSFWMFFVVAVDMLWQPVPYKFLQVCGGQCGQGRRRHDPWWHQSYGEAGRLPRVPAKRRSSVETDGDLGVSWENLGKWWENDRKWWCMERLGQIGGQEVQFPGWLMVELFGPVVFFSGILTLQFFKMASPVFRLRRNSGSTTTNMTSSRSNPTRVATRLGWKELAPPSNYGAKSAWELNASFWLWMSLRRSSRKNHHETSSICMYCINVNINKIK